MTDLSIVLEIPKEQIEDYEYGRERISSSHLWELAGILDVPIEYFFEGVDSVDGQAQFSSNGDVVENSEFASEVSNGGVVAPGSVKMVSRSEIELNLFDLVRPAPQGRGRH